MIATDPTLVLAVVPCECDSELFASRGLVRFSRSLMELTASRYHAASLLTQTQYSIINGGMS
jgi:hypothetical protein